MCLNSNLRKICLPRRAVHVLSTTLRHFFQNLKSASSTKKIKNSPRTCSFNRETKVACTRGERRVRARYILWRTKHKPRLLTLCHSWGANAYYRLFFVKVEHHRHAMKFSSIIVRKTGQLISKPFHITLRWSISQSGKKVKSMELFRRCVNPVSCVRGAKIISVCFLWEINFWYSWRAVYSMNAKLIASGLSWSYKKIEKNQVISDSFFRLIYWGLGPKKPLKSIC